MFGWLFVTCEFLAILTNFVGFCRFLMCVSVIIIPIGISKVNAKYIMDENRCIEKEPAGKSLV